MFCFHKMSPIDKCSSYFVSNLPSLKSEHEKIATQLDCGGGGVKMREISPRHEILWQALHDSIKPGHQTDQPSRNSKRASCIQGRKSHGRHVSF